MIDKIKKSLIVLLASYFIYRFYFTFISTAYQQLILLGGLGLYIIFNIEDLIKYISNLGKNGKNFYIAMLLHIGVILATFFIPIIYKTNDFSYLNSHIRSLTYLISYIVLIDLIRRFIKPKNIKDEFIKMYIAATRNYVIVSLVMIAYPPLKYFWQGIILDSERNIRLANTHPSYATRYGWAGFSAFSVTFFVTLGVVFCLYLITKDIKNGQTINKRTLFSLALHLIGNALYGRIGLFTSLGLVFISIMYILITSSKKQYAILFLSIIGGVFIAFSVLKNYNSQLQNWYSWVMEPITNFINTGTVSTASTDRLLTMYSIPSLSTFIFGDGYYSSSLGGYYMSTDVGFIRPILFYGVFFLILGYVIIMLLLFSIGETNKRNIFMVTLIFISVFLFEFKGEVILQIIPLSYTLFLAESRSLSKNRIRNLNRKSLDERKEKREFTKAIYPM